MKRGIAKVNCVEFPKWTQRQWSRMKKIGKVWVWTAKIFNGIATLHDGTKYIARNDGWRRLS
jgi:hypothetical protein